ncbi:MAG: P-loop NTPase [Syntrophomonadaceae bacterium]|nr:P-loop NTPase [Syntrophomonadaceae bacterium]
MSEICDQNCSSCSEECGERREPPTSLIEKPHELSRIKKVYGIVSGKGGVGKSLVTSMLAVAMNRRGFNSAILDADITGPSIPKAFGLNSRATANTMGLLPIKSQTGIDIMSVNLLLENATDPVVWRGPMLAGAVKQFWTDVIWYDVDFMFIDMPPGTADVPLTVFQSIPLNGIIIVTSPQDLVSMVVSKAVIMAKKMNVPVVGLVENMAYFKCPDCDKEHKIFGDSQIETIASQHQLEVLARIPIDPKLALACDQGKIEEFTDVWLEELADLLQQSAAKMIKIAVASEDDMVADHFGHCQNFNIFEVADDKIIKSFSIPNPGHIPGFLPQFLDEQGVNVIISGAMGSGAVELFNEKGIEVVTGASGRAEVAAGSYLNGLLVSSGVICQEHQHQGGCGH